MAKKKAYSDIARQINHTKSEIDTSVRKLETMKAERETEGMKLLFAQLFRFKKSVK